MINSSSRPDPNQQIPNHQPSLFKNHKFLLACFIFVCLLGWNLLSDNNVENYATQEIDLSQTASIESKTPVTNTIPDLNIDSDVVIVDEEKTNLTHTSTRIIKKNDTIGNIFRDLNLSAEDLNNTLKNNKHAFAQLKPGQKLEITYKTENRSNKFLSLTYYNDKLNYLTIQRDKFNNFIHKQNKLDLSEKTAYAKLTINSSLFEDAMKQKVPLDLIYQVIDIFTFDIDFAQDLRKNDSVEILYQEFYLDGKLYTSGHVLAVNFFNNGSSYGAIRYEDKINKHIGYYTPNGLSLHKAFIRTPVKFTRISSNFSMGRSHPILHKIRAHKGVDYAAPSGTPIKAVGDGKIIFYGRKGGYGKTAIIQHGHNYSTLYAHMSNFCNKFKNGGSVKQGDIIGYVGQTGLATGPHLHFEFRINDQHVNPLTVALPRARSIDNKNKVEFSRVSSNLLASMQHYSDLYKINNNQSYAVASNTLRKFE